MRIQKYLHSCLLVSEGDEKLLIDPGTFSFVEGKVKPEHIEAVDVLLLTHEHSDHYYPDAVRTIAAKGQPRIVLRRSAPSSADIPPFARNIIITHQPLAELLTKEDMKSEITSAGETLRHGPFTIQAVRAPHGALPVPKPENLGYLINKVLFHPGDSLEFSLSESPKVLALPVTAPWLTLKQALDTAIRAKPEIVIPIHDAIMKDFMLERIYAMCKKILAEHDIAFHPLKLGEVFEI